VAALNTVNNDDQASQPKLFPSKTKSL